MVHDILPYRQVYGSGDVQVWGKLYYVNDSAATFNHNWHIHRDIVRTSTHISLPLHTLILKPGSQYDVRSCVLRCVATQARTQG